MYIPQKFVVSSILTLCMLTVSFLLSSLTVIQNSKIAEMAINQSIQNNESALLIESMPQSCVEESLQESEACLHLNKLSVDQNAEVASNDRLTKEEAESFWGSIKTLTIMIPESEAAPAFRESIVTTILDLNQNQTTELAYHTLERTNQLACDMITDELLGEGEPDAAFKNSNKSGSVCIELYRDNGDTIANSNDDQFIGFSLVMDHSSHKSEYDQFPYLTPGTYFAKVYSMIDSSVGPSLAEQSIASNMSAESEN